MDDFRYSRWDGTQQVFEPSEEDVMEELADDLMGHGDLMRSLRSLFQRGMQDPSGQRMQGLRDMLQRLRERRQEQLGRYNLDSVLDDIKERLGSIEDAERQGIDRRLDEARQQQAESPADEAAQREQLMRMLEERAARNRERLDNLPDSPAGAIRELNDYDFMDPEAQRQFQELMDLLKQRVLENTFQDMRQQLLQNMTPGGHGRDAPDAPRPESNAAGQDERAGAGLRGLHGQVR